MIVSGSKAFDNTGKILAVPTSTTAENISKKYLKDKRKKMDILLYLLIFGSFFSGSWLFFCALRTDNRTPLFRSINFRSLLFGGTDNSSKSRSLLMLEGIMCFIAGFAFLYLLL
ncbi:hypothetical protein [Desulfofustis glycolicus]|uniref:hypothetical protein n=1 Tax=Desulfofustis glycolicus TaxID=51195 RepID=UPI0011612932|nr:hypothetical protein [Desulfofustis glycolicus]